MKKRGERKKERTKERKKESERRRRKQSPQLSRPMASSDRPLRAFHSHKWNPFFFNLNFFFLNLFFDFVSISHFRRLPYRVFPFFLVVSTRWWQKNWKKKLQKNKKKEKQKKSDCGGSSCVPISSLKKKKKKGRQPSTQLSIVFCFSDCFSLLFFCLLIFLFLIEEPTRISFSECHERDFEWRRPWTPKAPDCKQ